MSAYNADELVAPQWMNEQFFEEVLRNYEENQNIEVIKVDVSPASLKGDHYASIMFRGKVQYKMGPNQPLLTKSLILKTLPEEGEKLELLKESKVFKTEIDMYTRTLPKIAQILAEHGDPINLAPKLLYSSLKPRKIIILEDLCELGYDVMRSRQPTDDEMKAIYGKLAKMHAITYMMGQSEEYMEDVTLYQDGICSSKGIVEFDMFKKGISQFLDILRVHEEFNEYLPKFQAFAKDVLPKSHELYCAYQRGVKNEIFTVNHGDFHLKNFMFRFDEKMQMEDFVMVDFQLSVYAPPIIDLMYSKYFMCDPQLRGNHDIYMREYFKQFNETLRTINFKGEFLKYCDLKISALRYRHFTIFILMVFIPLWHSIMATKSEDVNLSTHLEDKKKSVYDPLLIAEIRTLLPKLLSDGYLD